MVIYKPGFITDRDKDKRFFEGVFGCLPFIPKIKCVDLAAKVLKNAEIHRKGIKNIEKEVSILSHDEILKL